MKITVLPSDNICQELGQNTYDYKDLLSELIDNSLAARDGTSVCVKVDLLVDKDQKAQRFVISDDAAGISADKLGSAITPAGLKTDGSLNEHGLGMKQAVAALGQLESLVTKTADREHALEVTEFRFGEIEAQRKRSTEQVARQFPSVG
ncbi:MAG: ATP-binding protein [Bryobacteraceae bacterium]